MADIIISLQQLPCPTKTYLDTFRANGILLVEHDPFSLQNDRNAIEDTLKENIKLLE
jgi:hypothetical protein